MSSDPRFQTGDALLDAALAEDDAKLAALGAYDTPMPAEMIWCDVCVGAVTFKSRVEPDMAEGMHGESLLCTCCGARLVTCFARKETE